jgi:hypothetical protein
MLILVQTGGGGPRWMDRDELGEKYERQKTTGNVLETGDAQ